MEKDVFISYSHFNADTADSVCEKLESNGIGCWYAPRDIGPGDEWASAIMAALNNCKVMILVFSEESNQSVQVLREVDKAVSLRKVLIPYRIDDIEPTEGMAYYLSTLEMQDEFDKPRKAALDDLLERVRDALAGKVRPAALPSAPKTHGKAAMRVFSRGFWTVVLLLTALVLLFTWSVQTSFKNETTVFLGGIGLLLLILSFFVSPLKVGKRRMRRPWAVCAALCAAVLIPTIALIAVYMGRAPGTVSIIARSQEVSMNSANYSIAVQSSDGYVYYHYIDGYGTPGIRRCSLEAFRNGDSGTVIVSNVWADNLIPLQDGRLLYRDYSGTNYKMKIVDPETKKVRTLKNKTTSHYNMTSGYIFYNEEGNITHGLGVINPDGRYDGNFYDFELYDLYFYGYDIYYINSDGNLAFGTYNNLLSTDISALFIIYDDVVYFRGSSGGLFKAPLDDLYDIVKLSDETPYSFVAYDGYIYFISETDNYSLYRVPMEGGESVQLDIHSYTAVNIIEDCLYLSAGGNSYSRILIESFEEAAPDES